MAPHFSEVVDEQVAHLVACPEPDRVRTIPPVLHGRPFTRDQALAVGVTDRMLSGARLVRIHPGVYRTSDTPETFRLLVDAALLKLPPDAVVSHTTALRLRGLEMRSMFPLHFSLERAGEHVLDRVRVHRYKGRFEVDLVGGRPVSTAERTFVDCATFLSERELLAVGDWLVAHQLTLPETLEGFALESHFDGVQRARRVAPLVRAGVASPRESDVRWHLVKAGLPEPEINGEIFDDHGAWLARGDLVYREQKVLVEYDGWQHERDAKQRQWDGIRREQLEAAGWRVVVITTADMSQPSRIVTRVRQALRQRGLAA